MKKIGSFLSVGAVLVLCAALVGCSSDFMDEQVTRGMELSDTELLVQLGYDTNGMTELEDCYLLLPDVAVSKSVLTELRKKPQTRIQIDLSRGFLTMPCVVYLNDQGAGALRANLREAVYAWNGIPDSGLEFVIDNTVADAVVVKLTPLGSMGAQMSVERPVLGKPGKQLILNSSKLLPINARSEMKTYLMMHALGHIAGFEHALSGYPADGSSQNQFIIGNQIVDPNSIMRPETDMTALNPNIWSGFSKIDVPAIQSVYGCGMVLKPANRAIYCEDSDGNRVSDLLKIGDSYKIIPHYEDKTTLLKPRYEVSARKMDGDEYCSFLQIGDDYYFTPYYPGRYKVSVKVLDQLKPVTFDRTFEVYAQEPWIKGPENVTLGNTYTFTVSCWNPDYPDVGFDVSVDETLFNSPKYTIVSRRDNTVRIRFDEPGEYVVKAAAVNGPANSLGRFEVNVYYEPEWSYSQLAAGLTSLGLKKYSNIVYFYEDAAHNYPLSLPHRLYFRYNDRRFDPLTRVVRPIYIPKFVEAGKTYVNLGESVADSSGAVARPYIITFPTNSCKQVNPYIGPEPEPATGEL